MIMKRFGVIGILACLGLGGCTTPEVGSVRWLHHQARIDFKNACIDEYRYANRPLVMIEHQCREASWRVYPPRRP
jgi:hypothetical protein